MTSLNAEDLADSTQLTLERDMTIQEADGEPSQYQFANIASIAVDDEGNIYVLDGPDPRLRVFGPDGTYLRDIGSVGDGPGEFRRPRMVAVQGDTLFVVHQRLEIYKTNGDYLGSVPGDDLLWNRVRTITPVDHHIVVTTGNVTPAYLAQDSVAVRFLDVTTGQMSAPIVQLPLPRLYEIRPGSYVPEPLSTDPRVGVTRDGRLVSTLGTEFVIDFTSLDGEPLLRLIGPVPRIRVLDDDLGLVWRGWRELGASESVIRRAPRPQFRPTLGRMLVGAHGTVVVERLDLQLDLGDAGESRWWNLIGRAHDSPGRFRMSRRFLPFVLRSCWLIGVLRDDLGVNAVVRYRIAGPGAAQCEDGE